MIQRSSADFSQPCPELSCFSVLHHTDDTNLVLSAQPQMFWKSLYVDKSQSTMAKLCGTLFAAQSHQCICSAFMSREDEILFSLWFEILIKLILYRYRVHSKLSVILS